MSLNVSIANGTHAGRRKPFQGGHGPNCVCSTCLPYPDGHIEYVPPKESSHVVQPVERRA